MDKVREAQQIFMNRKSSLYVGASCLKGGENVSFIDARDSYWDVILAGNQITTGCLDLSFKPGQKITRVGFLALLARGLCRTGA